MAFTVDAAELLGVLQATVADVTEPGTSSEPTLVDGHCVTLTTSVAAAVLEGVGDVDGGDARPGDDQAGQVGDPG